MGYLGKISAIVSANTSDFQSKMSGAAKDVQKFASSMQGALSAAQTKSSTALRGIYTEAQKLERALQAVAGKKLAFKGFDADGIQQAVGRMQALYSATKQINQPLAEAAASLNKLPASVQAGFLPAMVSAQTATEKLADTINRTGTASESQFEAVAKKVDLVTASMRRLQEASGMVSRLTKGDSLKFASPRTFDALSAAERSQRATDQLPGVAVARMGIGQQQAKVAEAAARVRDKEAVRERRMVSGAPTWDIDAAIADETDRLEAQIRVLDRRNEAAQKFALIMKGGFVPADDLLKSAKQVTEGPKAQGREKAFQDEVAILKYRSQAEKELEAKRVAAEEKVFQNEVAALKYRAQAEAELDAKRAAAQRKAEDNEIARLINKERAGKAAEDRRLEAAAIRSAAEEMRKLKAASDFGGRFNEFFETSQIDSYKAKLMTLRQMLVAAGVSGGAAAEQLDKFAETLQESSTAAGGLAKAAPAIQAAEQAAASAVAKATKRSPDDVMKRLKAAGDVGRLGVDKFSLALNQAAFAIDDFFSSTGGIEFKLRAVSNNITQLAFIIGETKGLFIGLAAVIGGQVAVGLMKWINNGRTAEDQTKALNDALARQKSLAEELAQAFQSLGDSITRNAFSRAGQEAMEFAKEIEEIKKKQKELRQDRAAGIDPTVQRERATQGALGKRLENETDIGRRVAIQAQIEQSRRREKVAAEAAAGRTVDRGQVAAAIERSIADVAVAKLPAATDPVSAARREQEAARIRTEAAAEARRQTAGDVASQKKAVQAEIDRLAPIAANGDAMGFGTSAAATKAIARLQEVLVALESPLRKATDALVINILEGAQKVSTALGTAQQFLDEAVIPFSSTRDKVDAASNELRDVIEELATASDPDRIRQLEARKAALGQQSSAYRQAAETVRLFADVVKRVSQDIADAAASELRGDADKARRDANRAQGEMNVGGPLGPDGRRRRSGEAEDEARRAADRRDRLERAARDAESLRDSVRQQNERGRQRFEKQVEAGGLGQELQELIKDRKRRQSVVDNDKASVDEKMVAQQGIDRINQRLARAFEDSAEGQAARARGDRVDVASQEARARLDQEDRAREASDRGRELAMTPAQKAAREATQSMDDIREYFTQAVENSTGLPVDIEKIRKEQEAALQRAGEQQMRQAAPMIFDFADEFQNALLQGPSRAELKATDVSTMEGSRELNRLLRGDDPAKDVNLVELRRQNETLQAILQELKDGGVVVDL